VLRDAPRIALDTESNSFHAYRPRVCLLQISVPGHDLLIDPLAGCDLSGLGELLGDAQRTVVLHAAENDVIQMQHEFGWRIPGLFDTQVASFVLGLSPYSLAGILEARFGVKLDKSEQRSDWSLRPLSEKQQRYAAEDTHYLLELADELQVKVTKAGRDEEIAAEFTRIAAREWKPEPFDPEGFRRFRGSKELDGIGLRILRDLYLMRNSEAESRDRAPFRITSEQCLITVAQRRLTRDERGIPKGFWKRYGRRVAGIVRAALERGPLPEVRRTRTRGIATPPDVKRCYERLRRWRSRAAEERGVETWVVARNELLMRIAQTGARTPAELESVVEPFRLREYGEAMVAAMLASG